MPNWTKGPWEMYTRRAIYRVGEKEEAKLKAYGMPTQFEAVSIGTKQGQIAIIPLDESSLANGQLISAAPEMYKALTKCLKVLMKVRNSEWYAPEIDEATRALTKADKEADDNGERVK